MGFEPADRYHRVYRHGRNINFHDPNTVDIDNATRDARGGDVYLKPTKPAVIAGSNGTDSGTFTNAKILFSAFSVYPPYDGGDQVEVTINGVIQYEDLDYTATFDNGRAASTANFDPPTQAGSYITFLKHINDDDRVGIRVFA